VSEAGLPVSTLDFCVLKTLVELENFGVTVAEGDKVSGRCSLPAGAQTERARRAAALRRPRAVVTASAGCRGPRFARAKPHFAAPCRFAAASS
jgi:hypothetical protein